MHVGAQIGLAALGGAAAGTAIGFVNDEPNRASGSALTGAGIGTMGLFAAFTRRGAPFTSQGFGLLGVGIGALWAGVGVTTLLRSGADRPVRTVFNPAEHLGALQPPTRTTSLPAPSWEQPRFDPLRSGS